MWEREEFLKYRFFFWKKQRFFENAKRIGNFATLFGKQEPILKILNNFLKCVLNLYYFEKETKGKKEKRKINIKRKKMNKKTSKKRNKKHGKIGLENRLQNS